jgi:uncharacterized protein with HEPN domain
MLEAARLVEEFARGRSRADLEDDRQLRFALLYALQIVGEAGRRVSDEVRRAHPEVPWQDIAGFRNRVVHGYFDVDLDRVWVIVTADVPTLIAQLESLLLPAATE